jgi:hypothetical protein
MSELGHSPTLEATCGQKSVRDRFSRLDESKTRVDRFSLILVEAESP